MVTAKKLKKAATSGRKNAKNDRNVATETSRKDHSSPKNLHRRFDRLFEAHSDRNRCNLQISRIANDWQWREAMSKIVLMLCPTKYKNSTQTRQQHGV